MTGKGKQPAPICVIGGLQDNNISFDARDNGIVLLDDANNADWAINSNEADGAIADDDTSKADEIDLTNKSQDDYKCDWAHVVECKHRTLMPLPCTFVGCDRPVHHVCQGLFEVTYSHDHHLSVKCCLHHPNTPFKTTKPLSDQPQPPNSASKSDDDKEDDDHPRLYLSLHPEEL